MKLDAEGSGIASHLSTSSFQPKTKKEVKVRVTTMDADLEFGIDKNATGNDLFVQVCRMIGIREMWYFGLQYTNSKGSCSWLKLDKKILSQKVSRSESTPYHFLFLAKFFPEDVSELIQDVTQHLFYLQMKQAILTMDVYCPPEASVLLASYATQAKFGDYSSSEHSNAVIELEELLPPRVVEQYQMTAEMWQERISTWWAHNKGYSREDAEIEYLRIAQDLDMFGVTYFSIQNKNNTDLYLGIAPIGLHIFEKDDKLHPKTTFHWCDVSNISFKRHRFLIRTQDKNAPKFVFYTSSTALNQVILELCVGYHNLYLRRRQSDSLELQQMKAAAREERARKQEERLKLEQEQQLRLELEQDRDRLQREVSQMHQQIEAAQEALHRSEETADLLAEKARISEEEALVLAKRASDAEAETQRIKISALVTEHEKILMEQKAREAQLIAARILEDSEKRAHESSRLKEDLMRARHAENVAKDKLRELADPYMPLPLYGNGSSPPGMYDPGGAMGCMSTSPLFNLPSTSFHLLSSSPSSGAGPVGSSSGDGRLGQAASGSASTHDSNSFVMERDIKSLSAELEKERNEYIEKSRHLQEQLCDLRSEIEGLKVDDKQSDFDRTHNDHIQRGDTKYSSLRRSGAGTAKSRIALFDGL